MKLFLYLTTHWSGMHHIFWTKRLSFYQRYLSLSRSFTVTSLFLLHLSGGITSTNWSHITLTRSIFKYLTLLNLLIYETNFTHERLVHYTTWNHTLSHSHAWFSRWESFFYLLIFEIRDNWMPIEILIIFIIMKLIIISCYFFFIWRDVLTNQTTFRWHIH